MSHGLLKTCMSGENSKNVTNEVLVPKTSKAQMAFIKRVEFLSEQHEFLSSYFEESNSSTS